MKVIEFTGERLLRLLTVVSALLAFDVTAVTLVDAFPGKTWYVSPSASADGQGTELSPFCAIQDAVDAAAAGDVIKLGPGVYRLGERSYGYQSVSTLSRVVVDKKLKIVGAGRDVTVIEGAAGTAPDADGLGAGAVRCILLTDAAAGSLIEKVTLRGGRTIAADVSQTTEDASVQVCSRTEPYVRIAEAGVNVSAKGGGAWYAGEEGSVYLVDVTVVDCRAGYEGGGLYGGFVLIRSHVDECRGSLYCSGAIWGATGAFSSLITACGGTASKETSTYDSVFGYCPTRILTCINCTMAVNRGWGVPKTSRITGTGLGAAGYRFYNCAFFDYYDRFVDNQGCTIWNSVMNSNGSMPNKKNNIGGDWGTGHEEEHHLQGGNNTGDSDKIDAFGWQQLVSPYNNWRFRKGSYTEDKGDASFIASAGTFIPEEYAAFDFDGTARVKGAAVDMGAYEGTVDCGARYTISNYYDYPIDVNGRRACFKANGMNYISGFAGEHLVLKADVGTTALYGFITSSADSSLNGQSTSYGYLFPNGQETSVDLVVGAAGKSIEYEVMPAASVVWVAPDGNNAAAGTFEAPYRTLQKANDSSATYGVVFAKAGTYAEGNGEAMSDSDWIRTTKCRLTITKHLRIVGIEGAEKTVIMGKRSDDTEGFVNNGCGTGAMRCVGCNNFYAGLQGFTLTGGATDSDPVGKTAAAGKTKSSNDIGAYNSAGGGVIGRSYPNGNVQHLQLVDCIVSNNIAYRHSALANVFARRCVITDNKTVDLSLETNSVTQAKYAVYASSLSSCLVYGNDGIAGSVVCAEDSTEPVVNCTISETKVSPIAGSLQVYNTVFFRCTGSLSSHIGPGTVVDPELYDTHKWRFRPQVGSPVLTAGASSAAYLAGFSGGRDGVWPAPNGPISSGCYQGGAVLLTSSATGESGVSPIGTVAVEIGDEIDVTATESGVRNFLGFEHDGEVIAADTCRIVVNGTAAAYEIRALYATNWYVNPSSDYSDANTGWSPESACRTLAAAFRYARPGDVVHAAEGVYEDGEMWQTGAVFAEPIGAYISSRVVVPNGVSLVAEGDPAKTIIKGHDDRETTTQHVGTTFYLGPKSVRCVLLGANAAIRGFTLLDGSTSYEKTTYELANDNTVGGGVLATDTSVIEDCVVSNCTGFIGTAYRGNYIRCKFLHCAALDRGGAGSRLNAYCCYVNECFDVPFADVLGLYNTTIGPVCNLWFGQTPVNRLVTAQASSVFWNNLILAKTAEGASVSELPHCQNNVVAEEAASFRFADDGVDNSVYPLDWLPVDSDGRPLKNCLAIGAGSNALLVPGKTDLQDVDHGQRIYNETVDAGCYEYDWRPEFAQLCQLKAGRVSFAGPDVCVGDDNVDIKNGSLVVSFDRDGGTVQFVANVLGGGTLYAYLNDVLIGTLDSSAGEQAVRATGPGTGGPMSLRLEYVGGGEGASGALISSVTKENGLVLLLR